MLSAGANIDQSVRYKSSVVQNVKGIIMLSDRAIAELKAAPMLCIDIETKDPLLTTHGPGCYRGDGYVCGLAVGAGDIKDYLSFRHPDTTSEEECRNRKIAADLLQTSSTKVGANLMYDLEWLRHEGSIVNGTLEDILFAEPLIDEYSNKYDLDSLGQKYLGMSKKSDVLERYCTTMGWQGKPVSNIWRMPSEVAAEYACVDVELPPLVLAKQKEEMERQGLIPTYNLEIGLIPLLLQMRKQGVRIDLPMLHKVIHQTTEKRFEASERVIAWAGREVSHTSGQIAKVFDERGVPYPRNPPTPKMREKGKPGNPNIDKHVLKNLSKEYPICKDILEWRQYDTLTSLFFLPYLDFHVNGRIHGQFHPLRSNEYGTVAGRFSASKPNLQQVSGDEEDDGAQYIRSLFIPEDGHFWAKLDYSQVEYRITAHYAIGIGSDKLRKSYIDDPTTDYHALVQKWTGLKRRRVKNLNFGAAYGMGAATAATSFGWTFDEAEANMQKLHKAAPYLKKTRNAVNNKAKQRGHIFTALGRKARFHPTRSPYSFFNRLIQGSAADVMKMGMVKAYDKGLFEVLLPHLTVHDEIDVSVPKTVEGVEALQELKHTMETAMTFDVPLLIDCKTGPNWGE